MPRLFLLMVLLLLSPVPCRATESRPITVELTVANDGRLLRTKLQRSSGTAIADQAALRAVKEAAPFKRLPPGSPAAVTFQMKFDYSLFGKPGEAVRIKQVHSEFDEAVKQSDFRDLSGSTLNEIALERAAIADFGQAGALFEQVCLVDPNNVKAKRNRNLCAFAEETLGTFGAWRHGIEIKPPSDANLNELAQQVKAHHADADSTKRFRERVNFLLRQ
jgi:TonB family protein